MYRYITYRNFTRTTVIAMLFYSCTKTDIVPEPQALNLLVPANLPPLVAFADNPLLKEGVELGRMLFYDTRLSGNNNISCGSCHHPEKSFSDGIALSNIGASGTVLHRHAPALINMAWANNGLFWDGGSTNLESQAFGPLTAADEMSQDLIELVAELNAVPDYVNRFRFVFKDEIKAAYVVRALAQFQRTLISANARYDKYSRNEYGGYLSSLELTGLSIVRQRCQGCHAGELFTDNDYHNNGIDDNFSSDALEGLNKGRARITYNDADLGKYRTPTLRNVMVTAPYMHDGRFSNIEQVLNHYSDHVKFSATLDRILKKDQSLKQGIALTDEEKAAVTAFLHTLTDSSFINNKSLAAP